ncbi:MAG: HD-GYP domain-containing protein [Comamonadaceae bacterium]|nr:HD-GYP domain-containing protein [Pseudomonadota bacterium]MBS0609650.1 HD-GYP domain-containing protein [Pseudomonadota bacterium]MDE2413975.1 HD-GYP domain-containing protein [Comamonadaceae bacterium]
MLKRIDVQHLTLGMYLHEFCGSWMEHPFWRARFVLEDPQDLARIRETTIREVWIDTSRGLDVASTTASVSRADVDAQVDSSLQELQARPPERPPPLEPKRGHAPMAQELRRAAAICTNAKRAVISMFGEARMGRAIEAAGMQGLVNEISDSVTRHPHALLSLARVKNADEYTYMHSVAVCALMVALARQIGLDEDGCRMAGLAGLLHDLGKAAIPLEILNKPGKLSDEEFAVVRNHPIAGHTMLQGSGLAQPVLDACLHHHEKIDGTGYPHRLAGDGIGTLARMAALCDVYDAITSDRPYKPGWNPAEALRRMAEWAPHHFDGRLFHAFVKCVGIYPVGSLVRLASGRLGVVTQQGNGPLTMPHVKVFFSIRSKTRFPPTELDLSAPGCKDKIEAREDPDAWQFQDLNELWSGLPHRP